MFFSIKMYDVFYLNIFYFLSWILLAPALIRQELQDDNSNKHSWKENALSDGVVASNMKAEQFVIRSSG